MICMGKSVKHSGVRGELSDSIFVPLTLFLQNHRRILMGKNLRRASCLTLLLKIGYSGLCLDRFWVSPRIESMTSLGNLFKDSLQYAHVSLVLRSVEILLNGSTTVWCISHLSQFCIVCKLAGGALSPIIYGINEEVKQFWTQYQFLGYTTTQWPPSPLYSARHNPLSLFL